MPKKSDPPTTATILISCPDSKGLVARIAGFISDHNGNIIAAAQHSDVESGNFFYRMEWDLKGFDLPREKIAPEFNAVAQDLRAQWTIHFSDDLPRIALFASRQSHCLLELIWRERAGELRAEIALIVSNHRDVESVARDYGIDFRCLEITKENKRDQERSQLELLRDYRIDLVVLARYMQILSPEFLTAFPEAINIHHSFLPAFPGANPYRQAFERGVKIIGATAHYISADLDEGPIIEQDVFRVSHRDGVEDLARKGRELEKNVLARAVRYHLENRVLRFENKTVVFE